MKNNDYGELNNSSSRTFKRVILLSNLQRKRAKQSERESLKIYQIVLHRIRCFSIWWVVYWKRFDISRECLDYVILHVFFIIKIKRIFIGEFFEDRKKQEENVRVEKKRNTVNRQIFFKKKDSKTKQVKIYSSVRRFELGRSESLSSDLRKQAENIDQKRVPSILPSGIRLFVVFVFIIITGRRGRRFLFRY